MRLPLMLLLSIPIVLPISLEVKMHGSLICSAPFTANITLMEDDPIGDDVVAAVSVKTCEHVKTYEMHGTAVDSFFQHEVELYLKVAHDCPDSRFTEYCTRIGSFAVPTIISMDVAPGIMTMTHCKFFE